MQKESGIWNLVVSNVGYVRRDSTDEKEVTNLYKEYALSTCYSQVSLWYDGLPIEESWIVKEYVEGDPEMPKGYQLTHYDNDGWVFIMKDGTASQHLLLGTDEKRKRFQSYDAAIAYAKEHAKLDLEYNQVVPGWEKIWRKISNARKKEVEL